MAIEQAAPPRGTWFYDREIRSYITQALIIVPVVLLVGWFVRNTADNLAQLHIASGFDFLHARAGFNVETFIGFTPDSTYGYALLAGIVDTIVVAVLGIVLATILGLIVGIARLSSNWLIRGLGTVYVEIFRNIPPLLVIFFWYFAVIAALPAPRDALQFGLDISLSNRGFFMPRPLFGAGFEWTIAALVAAIGLAGAVGRWAHRRHLATGHLFPAGWTALALIVLLPGVVFVATGMPLGFDVPMKTRFNLSGGMTVSPEFVSLLLALGIYTASFIAEIVRAGIMSVNYGQTEAARSLGLKGGPILRLVVLPQALRVIIPPLTSEYLNLTKNTSLAVAIGFADLVAVGGSILNQTGQAVEVVLIWMAVYLGLSLIVSFLMNLFNRRMALIER
jgi:general L-amino acid transport system permease protein